MSSLALFCHFLRLLLSLELTSILFVLFSHRPREATDARQGSRTPLTPPLSPGSSRDSESDLLPAVEWVSLSFDLLAPQTRLPPVLSLVKPSADLSRISEQRRIFIKSRIQLSGRNFHSSSSSADQTEGQGRRLVRFFHPSPFALLGSHLSIKLELTYTFPFFLEQVPLFRSWTRENLSCEEISLGRTSSNSTLTDQQQLNPTSSRSLNRRIWLSAINLSGIRKVRSLLPPLLLTGQARRVARSSASRPPSISPSKLTIASSFFQTPNSLLPGAFVDSGVSGGGHRSGHISSDGSSSSSRGAQGRRRYGS